MLAMYLMAGTCVFGEQAESNPPTDYERMSFLTAAFVDNAERLRSGIYRAHGSKRDGIEGNDRFPAYKGDVEIFCAFDRDAGLFRFDRAEPQLFESAPDEPIQHVQLQMTFIRTRDASIHAVNGWYEAANWEVHIRPSTDAPSEYVQPISLQAIGLGLWNDVHNFKPMSELLANFHERELAMFEEEEHGLYQLKQLLTHPDGNQSEVLFWFSESQGYLPIESQLAFAGMLGQEFPEPIETARVTWSRINDVWVPQSLSMLQRVPSRKAGRVSSYELFFDWEGVNGSVPAHLFTHDALELPPGTKVFDHRLGRKILLKTVSYDAARRNAETERIEEGADSARMYLIIAANLALLVVLMGALLLRRYFRQRTS